MARISGQKLTNVKVSQTVELVPGYTEADVMLLVRMARQRAMAHNLPMDTMDSIFLHVRSYLNRSPVCQCCKRNFQKGSGHGPKAGSLSIHKVIASAGYVLQNLRVICGACNLGIGECNTRADVYAKAKALRWQANAMIAASKELWPV